MAFPLAWLEVAESKGMIAPTVKPGPPLDCSEREFQAAVIALAKECGWDYYHTHDSRRSPEGFPDLTFWRDRHFKAELKTETGRLTKKQREVIDGLRAAGVCTYVWRPSDWPQIVEILK